MIKLITGVITDTSKIFNTVSDFLSYKLDDTIISNLLGSISSYIPSSLSRFAFFYLESGNGDVELDLSSLLSSTKASKYILYVDLGDSDTLTLTNNSVTWSGSVPVIESGEKYVFYVYKNPEGNYSVETLYSSNSDNTVVVLKFNCSSLDFTQTFPSTISGYTPKYDATIDWGDGSSSSVTNSNNTTITHSYSAEGEYTVTISGVCQGLGKLPSTLTEVSSITRVILFEKTFSYCVNLTSVPSDTLKYATYQTDFKSLFQGSGLTSIPSDLLYYNTQLTNLTATFAETQITEVPEGLLDTLVGLTKMDGTFDSCYKLTEIPDKLFDNNINLKSIPRTFQATQIFILNDDDNLSGIDISNVNSSNIQVLLDTIVSDTYATISTVDTLSDTVSTIDSSLSSLTSTVDSLSTSFTSHVETYTNPHGTNLYFATLFSNPSFSINTSGTASSGYIYLNTYLGESYWSSRSERLSSKASNYLIEYDDGASSEYLWMGYDLKYRNPFTKYLSGSTNTYTDLLWEETFKYYYKSTLFYGRYSDYEYNFFIGSTYSGSYSSSSATTQPTWDSDYVAMYSHSSSGGASGGQGFKVQEDVVSVYGAALTLEVEATEDEHAVRLDQLNLAISEVTTSVTELDESITSSIESMSSKITQLETAYYTETNPTEMDCGGSWVITHNLNSDALIAQVTEVETSEVVYPSITFTSENEVTVTFGDKVEAETYKIVIK